MSEKIEIMRSERQARETARNLGHVVEISFGQEFSEEKNKARIALWTETFLKYIEICSYEDSIKAADKIIEDFNERFCKSPFKAGGI